ncbi:unnamed protein product, partial [Rotaria magnacalcarata]
FVFDYALVQYASELEIVCIACRLFIGLANREEKDTVVAGYV